jgi:hypothetical protein
MPLADHDPHLNTMSNDDRLRYWEHYMWHEVFAPAAYWRLSIFRWMLYYS